MSPGLELVNVEMVAGPTKYADVTEKMRALVESMTSTFSADSR